MSMTPPRTLTENMRDKKLAEMIEQATLREAHRIVQISNAHHDLIVLRADGTLWRWSYTGKWGQIDTSPVTDP